MVGYVLLFFTRVLVMVEPSHNSNLVLTPLRDGVSIVPLDDIAHTAKEAGC